MLFSVLFFLTFVYEVARGGLDWGPLKQKPADDVTDRDDVGGAHDADDDPPSRNRGPARGREEAA